MANESMHLSTAGYAALRFNEGTVMHYYNDPIGTIALGGLALWPIMARAPLKNCGGP
ncbi:hypothetical protein QMK61_16640 [Fulvimonas sp. R45]|uniref:hypothetical protein n=1 Tax=Fulvimonas sp. R45 TaxID=3045937 RepID=UPI002660459F|nr:hypothetical protein [Fulvimonas sp. R45]MDO1530467.1 hypothetical protein [Fulvimonas sp. R45]